MALGPGFLTPRLMTFLRGLASVDATGKLMKKNASLKNFMITQYTLSATKPAFVTPPTAKYCRERP